MLILEKLQEMIGDNDRLTDWYDAIVDITPKYNIDTPQRLASFIAQCSHESTNFSRLTENLNYKAQSLLRIFPKYFDEELAEEYAHNQERIANRIYANRMGNGDESSGDGWAHKGRGAIQLTGKDNYQEFADSIELPVEKVGDYLETPEGAIRSACWFWEKNSLNDYADSDDIEGQTRVINGGTLGLEERENNYQKFLEILNN